MGNGVSHCCRSCRCCPCCCRRRRRRQRDEERVPLDIDSLTHTLRTEAVIQKGYVPRIMSTMIHTSCLEVFQQAKLYGHTHEILQAWNMYLAAHNRNHSVVSYMTKMDSVVKEYFYGPDIYDPMMIDINDRHIEIVNNLLGAYLVSLLQGKFVEEAGVLYCAGAYHSEIGLTSDQLQAFVTSSIMGVKECVDIYGMNLPPRVEETFTTAMQVIVDCMKLGLEAHHEKDEYVILLASGKTKAALKKAKSLACMQGPAHLSWKKFTRFIQNKDL